MPKDNIKDHLDGNELDMSLNNLTALPVQELATIPKATHLDFSNNSLTSVPPEFCSTLTHIVKLDLSQNQISSLPANFGHLQKLQTLDLYNNKLTTLPVSMCHMKSLKWLDLKNNPLHESLLRVAGDCLDDPQCKKCALNVVSYMKKVDSEQERRRQKELQEEREREAVQKAAEEKERAKKRAERKAEKEKKKKEIEAEKDAQRQREEEEKRRATLETEKQPKKNGVKTVTIKSEKKGGISCCGVLVAMLIGLIAVAVGLYFYCQSSPKDASCKQAQAILTQYYNLAQKTWQQYTKS